MEKIRVRYADDQGRTREDIFETTSIDEMRAAFSERGFYILSEEVENLTLTERIKEGLTYSKGVSLKELTEFTKLLRTLLKAGMSLNDAIDILLDGAEEGDLTSALRQIQEDIREGISFSKALGRHPDIFPEIYVKTIVAGEKSGALENILLRLTEYFNRSIAVRRKIIAALIYPSILLMVSTLAVTYMVVAVVPEFADLFKSLEVPLPFLTSLLLDVSGFIGDWFALLALGALSFFTLGFRYSKTKHGKMDLAKFKSYIPVVKDLELKYAYSQFTRTLATMVEGGIPLLDSLEVVLDSLENKMVAERLMIIPSLLERGTGFGKALKQIEGIPNIMTRVIHVGEESGNLEEMLENLADHYDDEITELTDTITSLVEPVLFLSMALVVGTIIVALLYPVLTAASNIN
jgi:type IV pilus assembly protein PilC